MCKDQRRCGGEWVQRRRALIAVTRAGSSRISDEQSLRDVVEHAARPPVTHSRAGRTHLAGVVHAESVATRSRWAANGWMWYSAHTRVAGRVESWPCCIAADHSAALWRHAARFLSRPCREPSEAEVGVMARRRTPWSPHFQGESDL